jgi:hypothetical protein
VGSQYGIYFMLPGWRLKFGFGSQNFEKFVDLWDRSIQKDGDASQYRVHFKKMRSYV